MYRDPTPVMNSHEAQYICCMGLAPVKAGVFMVSVKYVLVVCTNVEVTLLGVCFSDGTPNSEVWHHMQLHAHFLILCDS